MTRRPLPATNGATSMVAKRPVPFRMSPVESAALRAWLRGRITPPPPTPGALTWTTGPALPRPWEFGCALNVNGTIWLVGDVMGGDLIKLDPGGQNWTTQASPFTYSAQTFCVAANQKIYAISGFESCWVCTHYVEELDPSTGILTPKAPIPIPCVCSSAAATPDGKIYVCGGCVPPPGGASSPAVLNALQIYDTNTNTWTIGTSMSMPRDCLAAVAAFDGRNEKIYAIGGEGPNGKPQDTLEIFDPWTGAWTIRGMPRARALFGTAVIASDIYCIGAYDWSMTDFGAVDIYNCATGSWKQSTSLSEPRWGLAAAALPSGQIFAVGGVLADWASPTGQSNTFDLVEIGTV